MPKAIATIGGVVIADSDETLKVEGNHYFPRASVNFDKLSETDLHTTCHWKGSASYYSVTVNGEVYDNAAWTYHEPTTERAQPLKDYVAFYGNIVNVEDK